MFGNLVYQKYRIKQCGDTAAGFVVTDLIMNGLTAEKGYYTIDNVEKYLMSSELREVEFCGDHIKNIVVSIVS